MDADDLYGLPLDQFVAERSALAKALRKDKQRDEATAVAGLRKPSVAAWAVNQLVRTQKKATKELFAAGDALRSAQEDLLAGKGDGRKLRAANEREREARNALTDLARGLLSADGHEPSDAVIERVGDTLHAAALDEGAREQVRDGRLERELRHAALGLGEDVFAATPAPRARPAAPASGNKAKAADAGESKPAERKKTHAKSRSNDAKDVEENKARSKADAAAERERAAQERADEQRREQDRKAARAAEAKTRRNAERAARALEAAEDEREQAAEALREADEVLAAARSEADEANAAHEQAQAELDAS